MTANDILWTLLYGKAPNPENPRGKVPGDLGALDGTLNAVPCRTNI